MKGHIYKRGKTYTYVIDVGRDPETGQRKQKSKGGFQKKKEAEQALRKALDVLEKEDFHSPSKENFSTFMQKWLNTHYRFRVSETTTSISTYTINKHLLNNNPFLNKQISKITTRDIDNFYGYKLNEGLSTSTVRKLHNLLNKALGQAQKWNMIISNPVASADPPSIKKAEFLIWNSADINKFLITIRNERLYILFFLAIHTGMRKGELLALKWSDINLAKRIINVRRSLSNIPGKGYLHKELKTKKSKRNIIISKDVAETLLQHRKEQEKIINEFGNAYVDNDLVICTTEGKEQDLRNVTRVTKRLIQEAGVPKIRFHDLRHTHASILLSEGIDVVEVSSRLGHTNPRTTLETYAHLVPNKNNNAADRFSKALSKDLFNG
ncbi:site-specific integrase [Terribacillus goriensis]|uniref:site-specific integrase n=1 Tax=Terribacillus saccharophilus TaxID=361277 RepID=UPI003983CD9C